MKALGKLYLTNLMIIGTTAFLLSCASIPELKLHYQLPPGSSSLKGKRVVLSLIDSRTSKDILGPGARDEFGSFSGNVTYSVADFNDPGFKIGPHKPATAFKESFRRRLEGMGVKVLSNRSEGETEFELELKEFVLDLIGRKWVVKLDYEARLIGEGKTLSMQAVNGQGERLKAVGRGGAHKLMGEIFTDTVNRLDIYGLFKQSDSMTRKNNTL
ncbi:MAG: hypothetical protein V2J25_02435 [Desulfatiglans sp.]|jgi:hypothetical protein|nr:hypothetical protein [Thermodesulfobacteriota bacterium]MEE4351702.1 hypothetical protein [Desulfatiglans sp.]